MLCSLSQVARTRIYPEKKTNNPRIIADMCAFTKENTLFLYLPPRVVYLEVVNVFTSGTSEEINETSEHLIHLKTIYNHVHNI